MKVRLAVTLGSMLMMAAVAQAQPLRDAVEVRDKDGNHYATAILCNDCKEDSKSDKCAPGAADGWYENKPCGSCLMKASFGTVVKYPYDLHFTGKLVDKDGKPIANRFVKMILPNGWGMRTKTSEAGTFRLMLGATDTRKDKKPIIVSLGERRDSTTSGDEHFAVYLLPPTYPPCAGDQPDKPDPKPKMKTKAQ